MGVDYIISFKTDTDLAWVDNVKGQINLTKLNKLTGQHSRIKLKFQLLPRVLETLCNTFNCISINDMNELKDVKTLNSFDDVIDSLPFINLFVLYKYI